MPFSAGRVTVMPRQPQSGQPRTVAASFRVDGPGIVSHADIRDRGTLGENAGNPYGIAGQQGPAINVPTAARAIRGRETPAVVTIDRRVDPQYSNRGLGGSPHQRQQQIPGKDQPVGTIELNQFALHGREEIKDPEYLARSGQGASRYAGGQTTGVGMANTLGSDIGPGSLNESPAPTRIPHVWNDGLNAAAGLNQYAFTQQFYQLFIKHPWLGRVPQPTRGIRSVSGVTAQMSTASKARIPAIFVPSAVG